MIEPPPPPDVPDPAEELGPVEDAVPDLGRSYQSLLEQQAWEVDGGEPPSLAAEESLSQSPTEPPAVPPPPLRIIEALLFVGGAPLTASRACEVIRGLTPAQFAQAIDTLNRDYRRQGRPYLIQTHEHGHVLTLRPRYQPVVERLYGTVREARLSPAAIDVLAVVAYRQPATKQEVDSLRGADSGSLLRQLVRRGLITVVQRGESGQREVSYGTTARFLELFRLQSLEDLPQTQDLQRL
jgi:segregation and condensation protein B